MKRIKRQVEYVQFLDHCYGPYEERKPFLCEAVGIFIEEDDTSLFIAPWVANGEADNSNNEVITIIKSCIRERRKLKF